MATKLEVTILGERYRRWLPWTALVLVLAGGVGLRIAHVISRPTVPAVHKFRVPLLDEKAEAALASKPKSVPGQMMTFDPTGKFLTNSIVRKPVFISGEAAWSLQGQLSDTGIEAYLSDRAARGFNLIIVDLVENYYSNDPPKDFYGNVPFNGADFTNGNENYWSRVDHTLNRAAAYGITVMADPAFVGYGCQGGYCQSYRNSSAETLTAYGHFLGDRYQGFPNIIWLIGGDADPSDNNVQSKLYALAIGIRSADSRHLMTTENYRGSSSQDIWSEASWLDLDALYLQPSEIPSYANSHFLRGTYPVFMLEDWYEGEHSMTESGQRQEAYWAVLSGGTLGRVFGNYAIWNFSWSGNTKDPWMNQLGASGSVGQQWIGKLFRSREHWKLVPDVNHTVLTAGFGSASTLSVAARTSDGQTIIVYIPKGNVATIAINMSKITDPESLAKSWWFNPRDGTSVSIGTSATQGTCRFTPPDGNDWVLVIDSRSANLSPPGSADL